MASNSSFFSLVFLAAIAACSPTASAPSASDTAPVPGAAAAADSVPAIDRAHLERELTPYIESQGINWGPSHAFSGYVHLAQAGTVVYSKGFGFRDRARSLANTADTSFRIGSVTKQFTAAAILRLEQAGKLAVSDPISKFIPDYPEVGRSVTVHQLLGHTGGLPSYTSDETVMNGRHKAHSPEQLLKSFWSKPLEFTPGSQWKYSNSGYIVLGVIIERVSGMTYAAFLKQEVFDPAGLVSTVVGDANDVTDRALGYEIKNDTVVDATAIDMSFPYAAGAIRSTAADLVRWHQALAGEAILSAASKTKLYTPVMKNYAYGWFVEEKDGRRTISHGGGIDGFLTSYSRVVDADLVSVVWSNNANVASGPIGEAAISAAFGAKLEPLKARPKVELDPKLAARCAGSYELAPQSRKFLEGKVPQTVIDGLATAKVAEGDGGLSFKPAGQPEALFKPIGGNKFANADVKAEAECVVPQGDGPATGFTIRQGGATIDFTRTAAP